MLFKPKDATKKQQALSLGARGEKAAATYLKKQGYKIIEMNFSNASGKRLGEIDIVAKDKDELVFVEVKTRARNAHEQQMPEENITSSKLYKLNKAASFYITKNNLANTAYRFDAISIIADPRDNSALLRHLKSIFL